MIKKTILGLFLFLSFQRAAMSLDTVKSVTQNIVSTLPIETIGISAAIGMACGSVVWKAHKENLLANAVKNNRSTIAKWLMMLGVDPIAPNCFLSCNDTALHQAVIYSNAETFSLLLGKATDVNVQNNNGFTPLLTATFFDKKEKVALLLKHGANPRAMDYSGNTSLHWAALNGFIEVAQSLLQNDVDVNADNNFSNTPLHKAAERGQTEIARLLLLHGANPELENDEYKTPFEVAERCQYHGTASLLKGVCQPPERLKVTPVITYLALREIGQ